MVDGNSKARSYPEMEKRTQKTFKNTTQLEKGFFAYLVLVNTKVGLLHVGFSYQMAVNILVFCSSLKHSLSRPRKGKP